MDDQLAVAVLGPMRVVRGDRPVEVTSGRLRSLLAMLAMSAGRPITIDRLAAAIWNEEPPRHIRRGVQMNLTRLRTVLGPGAIVTGPGGYLLSTPPDRVDALRFIRQLDGAASAPDAVAELAALDEALALWRGNPFEGIPSEWLVRSEGPRLTERYLAAVERRAALTTDAGSQDKLVAQLQALTVQHPLRESLWVRLLVALGRSGRQAEALERYAQIRARLADELGVEPGPELRQAHLDLLASRPVRPAAEEPATVDEPPSPGQLPADIDGFTGRAEILAALDRLLVEAGARAVVITAIAGTAGVGKTSLAVHWAHRVADRFPDGQLYINLRGFHPSGQAMEPGEAVRGFLTALGVPAHRVPSDLDGQAGLFRSLLAGKRMLVLLDNARDAGQVRPLLPGAPGCLAVVTSRNQLTSLIAAEGAKPLRVDLLSTGEARELLAARVGAGRVAAEPAAADEIIALCARLPLALAVAAARAALRPGVPLAAVAAQLREERSTLDALATDDPATDARAVFSWSYQALTPDAARLFRLIGLHPGPDLSAPAAASLAGSPAASLRPLLAELCGAHLLAEHAPGRYRFHDLLRDYASELAGAQDSAQDRLAARRRTLDHYLHTGLTAARLQNPQREPIATGDPLPGVTPEALADREAARHWFAAEHEVLTGAVTGAVAHGLDTHAWQIAWAVRAFLHRRGHWHSLRTIQLTALAAARRQGDRLGQAHCHRGTALACSSLGQHAEAGAHLWRALELYRELGDLIGQAHCHVNLGNLSARLEHFATALRHSQLALDLYVAGGSQAGEALALNGIGWSYAQLGEFPAAMAHCQRALALSQRLADRTGEASTWDSLGYAHHRIGQNQEAIRCFERALELFAEQGHRLLQARSLANLGDAHRAAGEADPANAAWRRSLAILDELDHPEADQVRTKLATVG